MVKKLVFLSVIVSLLLVACGQQQPQQTAQTKAQQEAKNIASQSDYYIPKNGVERRNYNWRIELSDDPTTILWCTFAFPMTNYELMTVPIIGKLTSGGKRPFPNTQEIIDTAASEGRMYYPELPGSDGMYGSSGEYRFGFGPGGMNEYYDFYNLPSFCTTFPTIFQTQSTTVVFEHDDRFVAATTAAQDALRNGDNEAARQILEDVINTVEKE